MIHEVPTLPCSPHVEDVFLASNQAQLFTTFPHFRDLVGTRSMFVPPLTFQGGQFAPIFHERSDFPSLAHPPPRQPFPLSI
jgi:hypothetical protein